jgi:chorismate lyase/3-hydroxybenzoate synthase
MSRSPFPFSIQFQSNAAPDELAQDEHVLAAIRLADSSQILSDFKPLFSVNLTNLDGDANSVCEIWKSPGPVQTRTSGDLKMSFNDDVLFGFIQLKEADYDSLVEATEAAYQQILGELEDSDYKYLLRIWNYFPSINDEVSGLERYRQFCLGRQNALDKFGNFPYAPPAATAIGTANGDLQVYFIAARDAGIQLENPRQVSAFLYPRQYGEVSPAFSRATYKQWSTEGVSVNKTEHLYISGTASIIGHETQHAGKVSEQLHETLNNVEALILHAHQTLDLSIQTLDQASYYKVYLRDVSYLSAAKKVLEQRVLNGKNKPAILYLQGDVCRSDLLVEIEAAYTG